jgi:hypothetical protein
LIQKLFEEVEDLKEKLGKLSKKKKISKQKGSRLNRRFRSQGTSSLDTSNQKQEVVGPHSEKSPESQDFDSPNSEKRPNSN